MSRAFGAVSAFAGAIVSGSFILVAYRYRAGQQSCMEAVAERYLEPVANTADGGWAWFPTGLTCRFVMEDGTLGAITPSPVFSAIFLAGLVLVAVGLAVVATSLFRRRR